MGLLCAECVEVDASRAKDNVLVAVHARDLQRVLGNNSVQVEHFSSQEITQIDMGKRKDGHDRIPKVEDVVRHVSSKLKTVIVDVKIGPSDTTEPQEERLAGLVVDAVRRAGCQNCVAIGKADGVLTKIHEKSRRQRGLDEKYALRVGLVAVNETEAHLRDNMHKPFRHATTEVLAAHFGMTDEALVDEAHEKGKEVYSWTANQHWMMKVRFFARATLFVRSR
eukprot:scaffold781_cov394-Prasinococcus_capsulatus_cf.AAC.9